MKKSPISVETCIQLSRENKRLTASNNQLRGKMARSKESMRLAADMLEDKVGTSGAFDLAAELRELVGS